MVRSNLHLKWSLRLLFKEWIGREQEKKQRNQVRDTSETKIRDDGWSLGIGSTKTKEKGILETYLRCRMNKTSDGLGGWVGCKDVREREHERERVERFCFHRVTPEMLIKHLSEDGKKVVWYANLEFWREVWTGHKNLSLTESWSCEECCWEARQEDCSLSGWRGGHWWHGPK